MELIKSVSGIRGIYNKTLTLKDISKYANAFSNLQEAYDLPILIARDSRKSGPKINKHLINYLINIGRDIIDCGIIPTPTAQLITDKFEIAGSIVITASHNTQEWNGMKFIDSDGTFLNEEKNLKLFKTIDYTCNIKKNKKGKISNYKESIDFHIDNIFNINTIHTSILISINISGHIFIWL